MHEKTRDHFSKIAGAYGQVRTTDEEPVTYIAGQLPGQGAIRAADIGCGDGRYGVLLCRSLPNLRLICVDANAAMLRELTKRMEACGIRNYESLESKVEDLDLAESSLDCVLTLNAIHHLGLETFLGLAARAVRPGGTVFIYTRTPEQNERTIWGRYFPGFASAEARLYTVDQVTEGVGRFPDLELAHVKTFEYRRSANLERLLLQARSRHYSTFSLYEPEEFDAALEAFAARIGEAFPGGGQITWRDENTLLHFRRAI